MHGNEINLSPEMITQCILSSGRAMADICIMITAFSVLTSLLDETGIIANISECISSVTKISPEIISGVIYAAIDVTNVEKLPQNNYRLLPLITGIVSSGGLCVIMQIAAVTSGKIRIRPLIILRVSAAFLSGILCRILMPLIIDDAYISVSAVHISSYNTQSPVPSVILIIMTGFLFYNYEGVREKISSGNLRQQNDFAKKGSP